MRKETDGHTEDLTPVLTCESRILRLLVLSLFFFLTFAFSFDCNAAEELAEKYRSFISFSPSNAYFPVLILCALLISLGTFFNPKIGLYTILFFIMVSSDISLEKGSPGRGRAVSVRIEDIVLLLVSAGWMLNRAKSRSLALIKNVPAYKGIVAMTFVIVISTFLGYLQDSVPISRGILYSMKRLEYFWIFFMILNTFNTYREVRTALIVFLCMSVVVGFIGITQSFFHPVEELVGSGVTATAGFGRANTLADLFLIITGVSMGLMICVRELKISALSIVTFSLILFALIMTKSRGAYISFPPMLVVAFWISRSRKILLIFFGFISLLGIHFAAGMVSDSMAGMIIDKHRNDISSQFSSIAQVAVEGAEADSSFHARYLAWKNAIPEILRYPFFGHGVGSVELWRFDNQYVHELYDTGLAGLLALLYMNAIIFLSSLRLYMTSPDRMSKGLSLGFICGQIGVLIHGITITNFYTIINMEAFWFVFAMIMVLYHNEIGVRPIQYNAQGNPEMDAMHQQK